MTMSNSIPGQADSAGITQVARLSAFTAILTAAGAGSGSVAVCVGGMCPQDAVLAVLRGGRVVSRQVCKPSPDGGAWFKRDVIRFGNSTDDSQADARLVELADYEMPLEQMFISRRSTPR